MILRFLALFLLCAAICRAEVSEAQLKQYIHYSTTQSNPVGTLDFPRERPIDQSTLLQVKFALEEFQKKEVRFVIARLNTPGGEVFAAMKIAELLQECDTRYGIPVVAVVNNWALSAGAMIALSCRFIAVTETSLMGAAEPVMAGGEGKMETAPEKMISALRAEFGSLAKYYGRNPLIAEAMVDKDIILVRREGEIVQLDDPGQIKESDVLITRQGKLLTLDAEQLMEYRIADIMIPIAATRDLSSTAERGGEESPVRQSPLFSIPFFARIPNVTLISYHDWKISFFSFLSHPLIASLLTMGLIIGIYMEVSHPGFGFPGIMALTCLALILLSSFATEAIHWLEVLLIALGVLLVLGEIFLLPGFGILGILGIACILFGIFAILLPQMENMPFPWDMQEWSLQMHAFFQKLVWEVGALILSLVCIVLLARFVMPRLLRKSPLVLQDDPKGEALSPEKSTLPPLGTEGEALTPLRPGGKVMVDGRVYDALTEGNFIEKGDKVICVKIQGNEIIVAKQFKPL